MEITKRRLADIVPYSANAKKHDKRQINNVAESIKQYGFVQPNGGYGLQAFPDGCILQCGAGHEARCSVLHLARRQ